MTRCFMRWMHSMTFRHMKSLIEFHQRTAGKLNIQRNYLSKVHYREDVKDLLSPNIFLYLYVFVFFFILAFAAYTVTQKHTHAHTHTSIHWWSNISCWATECTASGSSSPSDWGQCSWEQRLHRARFTAIQLLFQGKWADLRGQPQGEMHDRRREH